MRVRGSIRILARRNRSLPGISEDHGSILEELQGPVAFGLRDRPAVGQEPPSVNGFLPVAAALAEDAFRERGGLLSSQGAIQQGQRLGRHDRLKASGATGHQLGRIECGKHRVHERSADQQVDASSRRLGRVLGDRPLVLGVEETGQFLAAQRRYDRLTEPFGVEPARAGEHRVADLLAFQSATGEMPEPQVLGVFPRRRSLGHARHPVRIRQHDEPVQMLEAPAMVDQLARQVIEKLGMSRLLALLAEVVGGAHDRPCEMPAPDAVDQHPRHHRVFR